ncbi:NTP transferase domain-containing protein [Candidatus Micrarchaeota archaeon]|nr:NTP transferase domain-containing protein [Candidatus Micrarchaeota archaeon]
MTKAFVLCGGKGTRLRPYTYEIPKPMLPVDGRPILEHVVENLKANGFSDLIFTVGYKKEQIINHFGDGSRFGVKIEYLTEETPMNTAGSILPYKEKVKEDFLVVMGDHLTNANLQEFFKHHKKGENTATIGTVEHDIQVDFGVVDVKNGIVQGFREKPTLKYQINTAIYAFKPKVFLYIKEKEDFAKDVFPRMLEKNEKISSFVFREVWFDIGRIKDYEEIKKKEIKNVFSKD